MPILQCFLEKYFYAHSPFTHIYILPQMAVLFIFLNLTIVSHFLNFQHFLYPFHNTYIYLFACKYTDKPKYTFSTERTWPHTFRGNNTTTCPYMHYFCFHSIYSKGLEFHSFSLPSQHFHCFSSLSATSTVPHHLHTKHPMGALS